MAAAVIGGLRTLYLLSLLVIPAIYTLVDDLGRLLKKWFKMEDKHNLKTDRGLDQ